MAAQRKFLTKNDSFGENFNKKSKGASLLTEGAKKGAIYDFAAVPAGFTQSQSTQFASCALFFNNFGIFACWNFN